jgi:hypothetical protein
MELLVSNIFQLKDERCPYESKQKGYEKDRTRHATSEERDSSEKVRDLDARGLHGNDGRALER